jgi:sialate O-acetylesterase
MAFAVSEAYNASAEIATADAYPQIRIFTVGGMSAASPQIDLNASLLQQPWAVCSSASIPSFSAVAFFAGRALADSLGADVPLGLVSNNVGGTAIELWSSAAALSACGDPSFNPPYPPPYTNGAWKML